MEKKGREAIKTSGSQQDVVGVFACMNRIMNATKGCGQISSNNILFSNIWIGGVKTEYGGNV